MKKKCYVTTLLVATFLMLLATALPHHHHLESWCFAEEVCHIDGDVNDRHTAHHPGPGHTDCPAGIIKHGFSIAKGLPLSKVPATSPPLWWMASIPEPFNWHVTGTALLAAFGRPPILLPAAHRPSGGLRAPPVG